LRKLFLTGMIVLIFPGTSFQVIVVAICNMFFFAFLTITRPHHAGNGRILANMSSFALTFTMLLGLILKSVDDAQEYNGLIAVLLIMVNGSVCLFVLYLIILGTCGTIMKGYLDKLRKKSEENNETKEMPVEKKVEMFFTANNVESKLDRSVCTYLKMSDEERKEYENCGEVEKSAAAYFLSIEKAMREFDQKKRKSMHEGHMLRLLTQKNDGKNNKISTGEKKRKPMTKVLPSSSYDEDENRSKSQERAKEFWNKE
jgi:hypothetical protein